VLDAASAADDPTSFPPHITGPGQSCAKRIARNRYCQALLSRERLLEHSHVAQVDVVVEIEVEQIAAGRGGRGRGRSGAGQVVGSRRRRVGVHVVIPLEPGTQREVRFREAGTLGQHGRADGVGVAGVGSCDGVGRAGGGGGEVRQYVVAVAVVCATVTLLTLMLTLSMGRPVAPLVTRP